MLLFFISFNLIYLSSSSSKWNTKSKRSIIESDWWEVRECMCLEIRESMGKSMVKSIIKSISKSISKSIGKSINQSIG